MPHKTASKPIHHSFVVTLLILLTYASCFGQKLPKTLGEQNSSFSYIPIDPLPISKREGHSCYYWNNDIKGDRNTDKKLKPLRIAFPDQTARLAISQIDINGGISYGPVTAGSKNSSYKVTFDYAASDVVNVSMEVVRVVRIVNEKKMEKLAKKLSKTSTMPIYNKNDTISVYDNFFKGQTDYHISRIVYDESIDEWNRKNDNSTIVNIPVYIGFGVRLTSTLKVSKNNVNISGLGAISAGAEAGKISGTLVMQSLGITGESVRSNFPVQSEINQSTIQNALIAIGSIKSLADDQERTFIEPRILGFYNTIGGGTEVVNKIIAELARERVIWYQPCQE